MSALTRVPVAMLLLLYGCGPADSTSSREPEDFIATARVPDDLKLELVAREPQIVDPVALTFDADGRMYVVEMRDYPTQPVGEPTPLGRVKLLDDLDGDGFYETATVFADGLQFPTWALPWRGGILVTRPPDVVFLEDTDGDGVADVEEVLLGGFPVANTQHNINGLTWGLDNWVYGANGGNNGSAHAVASPDQDVSMRGMDFRFRPGTGELRSSYETTGGHGIAVDAWGHMFGTHNVSHIQHMVFRPEYLTRSPDLLVETTREQISDHEASALLYQISAPETRVNHPEQAGRFSGSSGIAYYGGGVLPPAYDGAFFVNDVVVNVVHQDVVRPDGPSFRASRGEEGVEFMAGDDNWFRPVTMAVGPDGGLYVVDMHRAVIEHPEWIPDQVEQRLDVRAGDDKGRIYRVVPSEGLERVRPELGSADVETLVEALAHPNKWWRDTAQRLLVERQDESAVPLLRRMYFGSDSALGRLHGLWTLEGLGRLDPELVQAGLEDANAGVRENAIRMAEPYLLESPELRDAVLRMDSDPDARVRLQVALTVGGIEGPRANEVLLGILRQDVEYRWSGEAVLAGLAAEPGVALEALLASGDPFVREVTDARRDVIRRLASAVGARDGSGAVFSLVSVAGGSRLAPGWRAALLDGLADGLGRGREASGVEAPMRVALEQAINSGSTRVVRGALRVAAGLRIQDTEAQDRAMARARVRVLDASLSVFERVEEVELLGLGSYAQVGETLLGVMESRQPLELQIEAAQAMARLGDEATGAEVLDRWRSYSPQVKAIALDMLLRRVTFHELLISALERGDLNSGELNLDLEQRRRLLRRSSDDVATRAAGFFGDHEFSNRGEIVDQHLDEVVGLRGDESRGQQHFESLCAQCHFLRGEGHRVGPDLGMAFAKGKEDLLTSILDPHSAIAPEYANYVVETTDGELLNGILRSETPTSITLMRAQGETDIVRRGDIREIRTDGLSLMPDGLEQGLEFQDLADLLAFLQQREQ
jgi:putative membrane-bound dehydrogenase-like protein